MTPAEFPQEDGVQPKKRPREMMQPHRDYRDRLRAKGLPPVRIERTVYRPGDKVLTSWAKPVEVVK